MTHQYFLHYFLIIISNQIKFFFLYLSSSVNDAHIDLNYFHIHDEETKKGDNSNIIMMMIIFIYDKGEHIDFFIINKIENEHAVVGLFCILTLVR